MGESFRLAAYAASIKDGQVLLTRHVPQKAEQLDSSGGRVKNGKDPLVAVIRDVAEETRDAAVVDRLLGSNSRVIRAASARAGAEHQNVGVFHRVRITGARLRTEPNGDTAESVWTPLSDVAGPRQSSLVDLGVALAQALPSTGHVAPLSVGGLIQH